jgi:TRAP-type C4-dicarboxylate transport system permease small subunit
VLTREIGHPWLWLQEVTSTFFTYGIFVGTAVATRRNDHLYLTAMTEAMSGRTRVFFEVFNRTVVLAVGLAMVVFGWQNFLSGFGSFRMPSMTPIASLYAAIPLSGALVALFSVEQIVNGLRNGFEHDAPAEPAVQI